MKKLLKYFNNYKGRSVLAPLFKLLEATFELLVPIVVGLIVDKGIAKGDTAYVVWMCALLALFGVLGFGFSVVAQYFAARTATGVSADIRKDLFGKLQTLSYADIDRLGVSTMLTRMTSDVDKLQSGINLALRLFLRSPFIVFGAAITACFIDASLVWIFFLAIALLAIVVFAVMLICMPLYKSAQEKLDKVTLSSRENLTGARVLRAFCQEENERALFDKRNKALNNSRKVVGAIASVTNPLTFVLVNLSIILLLYVGAIRVDGGLLSQGSVIALYNLMGQILIELIKLANLIVTVTKAAACGGRISAVLDMKPSLEFIQECVEKTPQTEEDEFFIRFDGVTMRYNKGASPAIENLSFGVKKGETVGIIGGTGSGKTTLVHLLAHFYDIESGEITVDGKSVRLQAEQSRLRSRIAIVPQKATLFQGTIRENLLWGKPDATDEQLNSALTRAMASEFVAEKGGLDAAVLQGGKNFSGGQKQRLTIARALVKDADILILDDSSSALDYATDAKLRKQIRAIEKTTFIVAQRASSVKDADKIIVLDEGKAVGIGKHDQLMKTCAVYREIYHSQYPEGEVAV